MTSRARALARVAIEGLISRRARFDALSSFAQSTSRLESDNFTLTVSMWRRGAAPQAAGDEFQEAATNQSQIISQKHQAMRLARMVMAYDFDASAQSVCRIGAGFLFTIHPRWRAGDRARPS